MSSTKGATWALLLLAFFSNILFMAGLAALQVCVAGHDPLV